MLIKGITQKFVSFISVILSKNGEELIFQKEHVILFTLLIFVAFRSTQRPLVSMVDISPNSFDSYSFSLNESFCGCRAPRILNLL